MGNTEQLINIKHLVSEASCYEAIRRIRWPAGVRCPHCDSDRVILRGKDERAPARQRYQCKGCEKRFDDLSETLLAGHHQPLSVWVLCLYLMGLNLSNAQIAAELDLNKDDVHAMTHYLREGIAKKNSRDVE